MNVKVLSTGIVCHEVNGSIEVCSFDEYILKMEHLNWWARIIKLIKKL